MFQSMDPIAKIRRMKQLNAAHQGQDSLVQSLTGSGLKRIQAVNSAIPLEERECEAAEDLEDVRRITALPILKRLTPEELEAFCQEYTLEQAYREGFRFNPEQAEGILAFLEKEGMYGPIAVGFGKTLLLQMIANLAYRLLGHQKIVKLLPKGLIDQYIRYDLPWARARVPWYLPPPANFSGLDKVKRANLANSNRRGVYLVPYSILSRESSKELLEQIKPTLILADESFYLANPKSALTRRVMRYIKAHKPKFVAVAGSITKKSPEDYAHLVIASLGADAPLPLHSGTMAAWSQIVSAGAVPSSGQQGPLTPLIGWARRHFQGEDFPPEVSGFRKAYMRRFTSAKGIVATGENELDVSLTYCNKPVEDYQLHPQWGANEQLMDMVQQMNLTPSGDEIAHKIHHFKWLYELTAGFYNELIWPDVEVVAKRRKWSPDKAAEMLHAGMVHHEASQVYARLLRDFLDRNPDARGSKGPIDTPFLIGGEMAETGDKYVEPELYAAWRDMKDKEVPGMIVRDSRAVRICDYKVRHALEWAKSLPKGEGSIIWVHHVEVGRWAYEVFKEADMDVVHCPAGDAGGGTLRDEANVGRHCIASLPAHYKGLNLQHHHNMFFLQFPRDAVYAEQGVGRIHRVGQKRDALEVTTCFTIPYDFVIFSACLVDALYQHQTGGGRQKLIYGGYDPMIEAIPPDVLKQMGIEANGRLDKEHQKLLADKWGGSR